MVKADVVNVVATAVLGQGVDLDELGKLKEVLHDSMVYGGRVAYFRSPNIRGTVSIFASYISVSLKLGILFEKKQFLLFVAKFFKTLVPI